MHNIWRQCHSLFNRQDDARLSAQFLSTLSTSYNHPSSRHLAQYKPFPRSLIVRTVASTVPASQTFDHTALNIVEEAGNSASDIAKTIAGRVPGSDNSFLGITSSIALTVPKPIMAFGLLGTVPYVGAGATTVYLASVAGSAAAGNPTSIDPGVALTLLDQALNFQVTYGAVMLSFLGALHWGMEFAKPSPTLYSSHGLPSLFNQWQHSSFNGWIHWVFGGLMRHCVGSGRHLFGLGSIDSIFRFSWGRVSSVHWLERRTTDP